MPATQDKERWAQNQDGSWSRTVGGVQETAPENPEGPAATSGAQEYADELGVDLSTIEGTGHGGKVTKADVEKAANG